jgi:uncharacterized membrane protein
MFSRSKTQIVKDSATNATELAAALAKDRKFRKELLSAVGHGVTARRRAAKRIGFVAAATRIGTDAKLRREVKAMVTSFDKAWTRVQKKRSHKLRNSLLALIGIGGAAAAAPHAKKLAGQVGKVAGGTKPRTIEASIEVDVPVATAYNQWTQFEDFPLFMEGVDHVQQLDDTRLHWVANVGGKKAEWDAKILEQHADKQISWISEDGKKTRGTVTFEPLGESRTLVRVTMSYQAEGVKEALGSAAGLDERRVRGDLDRFKELVESRGTESGAWRGEVSEGRPTTKS